MKIENEEKIETINYPKLNEINQNTIKNNTPQKWHKLGITSIIISFILKSETFASEISNEVNNTTFTLAGDISAPVNTVIERGASDVCGGITTTNNIIGSFLAVSQFTLSVLFFTILAKVVISSIASKIKKKEYKPKLVTKIVLIILLIVIVAIQIIKVLVNNEVLI